MRTLDYYYSLSFLVIVGCFVFMANRKFQLYSAAPVTRQIVIIGCNLEAAALANRLSKKLLYINITIIDDQDCSRDSSFTFVEGSTFAKKLVDSINFKYHKMPQSHGFWNGQQLQRLDESFYESIIKYGLSQYALSYAQSKIKSHLNRLSKYSYYDSIEQLFKVFRIIPKAKTLEYLLYQLGLDRQYVKDIIYPYLYGNYAHEMELNLLAAMLKLLQLFNPTYEVIGSESDIVFRLIGKTHLLQQQVVKDVTRMDNSTLFHITTTNYSIPNVSVIVYCNHPKQLKQLHHYITEVNGQLSHKYYGIQQTENLPFSIYSTDNIVNIRKQCDSCRKTNQKRYIIRSKFRLADYDLKMFSNYSILNNSTRTRTVKFMQPNMGKLTDGMGSFFPNLAFTVSDSRELSLSVVQSVAKLIGAYL